MSSENREKNSVMGALYFYLLSRVTQISLFFVDTEWEEKQLSTLRMTLN